MSSSHQIIFRETTQFARFVLDLYNQSKALIINQVQMHNKESSTLTSFNILIYNFQYNLLNLMNYILILLNSSSNFILMQQYYVNRLFLGLEVAFTLLNILAFMMADYTFRQNTSFKRLDSQYNQAKLYIEIISNIILTSLAFTKVISYGLALGQNTFLRKKWNIFDTLVLISSWVSTTKNSDIEILNVIKLFRILFFIRIFKTLQHQVNSFVQSFKELWKPFIPFLSIIFFYATLGLYIFNGLLESRCRLTPEPQFQPYSWPIDTTTAYPCGSQQCPQISYCRNPSDYDLKKISSDTSNSLTLFFGFTNFDSIIESIYTVQSFFTINGWITVSEMFWRSSEKITSGIYFGSLVILLAHIFGNIVLATLHESFMEHHSISSENKENKKNKRVYNLRFVLQQEMKEQTEQSSLFRQQLNVNQVDHSKRRRKSFFNKILNVTIQNIVQETEIKTLPTHSFFCKIIRLYLKKLKRSLAYKSVRFINIFIQTIILCLDSYNVSEENLRVINIIDFASVIILFIEISFEILSDGWRKYWKENLNRLDFVIALIHILIYSIEVEYKMDLFQVDSQYSIFIRSTKILRLYRLFYSFAIFESIKVILKTYAKTLKMIPGYFVLLFMLIILYAMIGRELFSERVDNSKMRINFNSLTDSLIAVILFCYNEEWHILMYEYYHYVGYKSIIFSLFCIYTCQVLFVRLFIAIFIHHFMNWLRFFENRFQASSPYINHMSNLIRKFFRKIAHYLKRRKQKIQEQQKRKSNILEMKNYTDNIFEANNNMNNNKTEGVGRQDTLQQNNNQQNNVISRNIINFETNEIINTQGQFNVKRSPMPSAINKPHSFIQDSFFALGGTNNASRFKSQKNNLIEDSFTPQSQASEAMIFKQNQRDSFNSRNSFPKNTSFHKFSQQIQKQQQQFQNQNSYQQSPFNESMNYSENFTNGFRMKQPFGGTFTDKLQVPDASQTQKEQYSCQSSIIDRSINNGNELQTSFMNESEKNRKYYSLFIFSPSNLIRILCKQLVENNSFNIIKPILLLIFGLLQALQEPHSNPNTPFNKVLYQIDLTIMIIFNLQTVIYTIAYGAVLYLGDKDVTINFNNFIEIILNLTHMIYFLPIQPKQIYCLKFFKIFRLLLLLPFLSKHFSQIKFSGKVLIACLPRMLKILIFGIIFMFINSVFVTKLLKGQMYQCNYNTELLKDIQILNKHDCFDLGGDWVDMLYQFNDVLQTMSVLFMIQSSEGWLVIMLQQFDSTQPDLQPKEQHSSPWIIFYIQFFFIANFCILNMFVGLVVDTFREMKENESKITKLTPEQKEWFYIKQSIYNLIPTPQIKAPTNSFGRFIFHHLIQGRTLKFIFYGFTVLNCVSIFGYHHRQSKIVSDILNYINLVCISSCGIEVLLKIICLKKTYFNKLWNWYDIVTLVFGIINLNFSMNLIIKSDDSFYRIFGGFSKGLQLVRVYTILIELKVMKKLLNSFYGAVSSILGLSILVIFFLFISVLIGMNLFPFLKFQNVIDDYDTNFTSFLMTLFTLVRIATSEYWFPVVAECSKQISPSFVCRNDIYSYDDYMKYGNQACGSSVSYIYFYLFFLVFTLFILNLLIASIILSYKEAYISEESAINLYQLEDIRKLWTNFDPDGTGFINYKLFWQFSSQVALIFGVLPDDLLDISLKKQFLQTLNIAMFEDPVNKTLVYKFHDVIVSLAEISLKIKYQIFNLEPDDKNIKKFHRKTLKKQALIDNSLVAKSMFRSRDMVVIITIIRKIKEWKKRYLQKEEDFKFYDLKNLTQKLKIFQKQEESILLEELQQKSAINEEIAQKGVSLTSIKLKQENYNSLKLQSDPHLTRKSIQFDSRKIDKNKQLHSSETNTPNRKSALPCISYSIFITPHIETQPIQVVTLTDQIQQTESEAKIKSTSAINKSTINKNIIDRIPPLKFDNFIQSTDQISKNNISNINDSNTIAIKKEKKNKKRSLSNGIQKKNKFSKNNRKSFDLKINSMLPELEDQILNYHYSEESEANKFKDDNFIFVYNDTFSQTSKQQDQTESLQDEKIENLQQPQSSQCSNDSYSSSQSSQLD